MNHKNNFTFAPQFSKHCKVNYLKEFRISFRGLSVGNHSYNWEIHKKFFEALENADIEDSKLNVELLLEKQDRMMILNFIIRGEVQVLCDRCLEVLFLPVDIDEKYYVKFGSEKKEESESECLPLNIIFFIVLLITAVSLLPWLRLYNPIKSVRNFINPRTEPIEIANYIKEESLKGNMFNDIKWGGYLIWKLWPEYKVFTETRHHLIPEEVWQDYKDVHFGLGDWENILNKYKISFVVLSKEDNKRIIEFIGESPGWKKVYEDEAGTIFVRK